MGTSGIAAVLTELVQIPSVNPLQAGPKSGDGGETAVAEWMATHAADVGGDVTLDDVVPGRPNVYARFDGTSDRLVAIDIHLDTVGVEHMTDDPFDGRIDGGRLFGRGSVDTKASLAVVLTVLDEFRAAGERPVPTLYLVGTISEEVGGLIGAQRFADWLTETGQTLDQIVVAEPTLCAPVHGHKGGVGINVVVHGYAAHSSKPHLGLNAIDGAARIVIALEAEQARLDSTPATTAVGTGTVSVTTISGGLAQNIIPDRCDLFVGRRVAPGEDPDTVFAGLRDLITAAADPCPVEVSMAYGAGSAAFYQDPGSPLVRGLAELSGMEPETATYGSNALMYPNSANEIVIFGPGSIDQAHQAVEWIDLSELDRAADIYRRWLRS
jgi:acetylornithine deacetylase/succinyl-diaminopimelate desuccinylase-like protein